MTVKQCYKNQRSGTFDLWLLFTMGRSRLRGKRKESGGMLDGFFKPLNPWLHIDEAQNHKHMIKGGVSCSLLKPEHYLAYVSARILCLS